LGGGHGSHPRKEEFETEDDVSSDGSAGEHTDERPDMRRTVTERRTMIEDALREQISESNVCSDGALPDDPRVSGQVFLAVLDGLDPDQHTERLLPVAVALEFASLQTNVHHRSAYARDHGTASTLTDEILTGDVLEAKAFEVLAGVRGSPRLVERCIATLVRATRRTQEGHALLYGCAAESQPVDADIVHRLGALTGGAAELAGLVAGVDENTRRRLGYHGSGFGFYVWSHTVSTDASLEDATIESGDVEDGSQWIEAIADCCPPRLRPRIREQLRAVLECGFEHAPAESIS
jgi:hypothetical protein